MNYACKRALDVVCAAIALAALSPLLLLIALLIKLDSPGPALFKQRRIGRGERLFTMIKFRTMYDGAHDRLHRESVHRTANGIRTETSEGKLAFKSLEDPRITRVGKVLRAWSVDELPQLFNILRGEMSIVGPRPALEYELPYYKAWHRRRFEVLPGITGLWQVKRQDQETFDDMMRLDVEYAQSGSVWSDIKLIAMTIPAIVRERGVF